MTTKRYGDFTADGREFAIERPDTPKPWINYLCTRDGSYVSLISANAGGYSYVKCPKDGRVTRWRYNSIPEDRPGKYLYLRNAKSGDFWTLSWQPTAKPRKHYRVRHGLGYSVFECNYGAVEAKATYFVPPDDPLEIWDITLRNTGKKTLELELYPFAEMCLGHALIDLTNKPDDQHFSRLWFDRKANAVFTTKTYWVTGGSANVQENKAWDQVAFLSASIPAAAYAGERERFFAPYHSEANPKAIQAGELENKPVSSGNMVSCLKLKITLKPSESRSLHVLLGAARKDEEGEWESPARKLIGKYRTPASVKRAFGELSAYWNRYLSSVRVETPCANANTLLNIWNQYQAKMTFLNSRNASYYQWGVLRGLGFRDSLQDTIGAVIQEPDAVRKRILQIAGYQRSDGVCAHCFHPVSGVAEFTGHKDDPLWLITASWFYLAETADTSILSAKVPFHDGKAATLLDHLKASVAFIDRNLGTNGIPTFGKGDWNDTLDFVGGANGMGESIWAGMFYAYNLQLFADLAERFLRDPRLVRSLRAKRVAVAKALNAKAWDGEWYIRAVTSGGAIIGSSKNQEGKIYLNPQTWAVLSGVAGERGKRLMATTMKKLDTEFGPKLLAPAYHKIDKNIGLITRVVWGKKENGAVFNHTTPWTVMALCELGETEKAMALYRKLMPIGFDQERYEIEPYVYAQYTTSNEHETAGQGSHSWLSGTSCWTFRTALDYLLGVRTGLDGIHIRPCLPKDWKAVKVTRKYRGTTYILRLEGGGARVQSVRIDGAEQDPTLPLPVRKGKTIRVDVTLS